MGFFSYILTNKLLSQVNSIIFFKALDNEWVNSVQPLDKVLVSTLQGFCDDFDLNCTGPNIKLLNGMPQMVDDCYRIRPLPSDCVRMSYIKNLFEIEERRAQESCF